MRFRTPILAGIHIYELQSVVCLEGELSDRFPLEIHTALKTVVFVIVCIIRCYRTRVGV